MDVLSTRTASIGIASPCAIGIEWAGGAVEAELGSQYDPFAYARVAKETSKQLFASAARVNIRRVDEIAALVQVVVEQAARISVAGAPAGRAEGHSP